MFFVFKKKIFGFLYICYWIYVNFEKKILKNKFWIKKKYFCSFILDIVFWKKSYNSIFVVDVLYLCCINLNYLDYFGFYKCLLFNKEL